MPFSPSSFRKGVTADSKSRHPAICMRAPTARSLTLVPPEPAGRISDAPDLSILACSLGIEEVVRGDARVDDAVADEVGAANGFAKSCAAAREQRECDVLAKRRRIGRRRYKALAVSGH